jgi:hypothetical protein
MYNLKYHRECGFRIPPLLLYYKMTFDMVMCEKNTECNRPSSVELAASEEE